MSDSGTLSGRFATFTAHILATASTPILGPAAFLLANPMADLFKGLAGDHVPGISNNLMQRLRGLDASKLNHDVQKGLVHALSNTKRTLVYEYEHSGGKTRELPKDQMAFLNALFTQLEQRIKEESATSSSLKATEAILGGRSSVSTSALLDHCKPAQEALRRNAQEMAAIVERGFDQHFQLHFSEYLKDKKNQKALIAYEQLTANELLSEVRTLRAELSANRETRHATTVESISPMDQEQIRSQVDHWLNQYPDVEILSKALAPTIASNMTTVIEQLGALNTKLDAIGDRTIGIQDTVSGTHRTTGQTLKLTLVVLVAVLGVGLFFVLDPMHLRSFRVKVEINGVHDYGIHGRRVERIAIAYANTIRDTAEVSEGFASFRIPDEYKNDDASLRLLCQGAGQSPTELAACDSQTIRLTDLDRIIFPATNKEAADTSIHAATTATERDALPSPGAALETSRSATPRAQGHPPCTLDGQEFTNEGALEDRLTLSGYEHGRISVSGELGRKPIDGMFRVNGSSLIGVPGSGNLMSGSLTLQQDCRQLKGNIVIQTPSGVQLKLTVNMVNNAR